MCGQCQYIVKSVNFCLFIVSPILYCIQKFAVQIYTKDVLLKQFLLKQEFFFSCGENSLILNREKFRMVKKKFLADLKHLQRSWNNLVQCV